MLKQQLSNVPEQELNSTPTDTNWSYMIRALQLRKGYSLSKIAMKSRISIKTIQRLAKNSSKPTFRVFDQLLKFYCFVFYSSDYNKQSA